MENERKSLMLSALNDMEIQVCFDKEDLSLKKYNKIPLSGLAVLGAAFSTIAPIIRKILGAADTFPAGELYVKKTPGMLMQAKTGESGYLGAIVQHGTKGIVGQARFEKVDITMGASRVNPAMFVVAAILMKVEKELDTIKETQKQILDFLKDDKEAGQKGDIIFLTDLLNNYKFNYDNPDFLKSGYKQTLEIKRDAEKNIIFYRKQIEKEKEKKDFIHWGPDVSNKIKEIKAEFKNYQMALYIYSFSTFLEIVLLENFNSQYLTEFVKKLRKYSNEYGELYKICYKVIEEYSKSTVEAGVMDGLAWIQKALGETIANVPLLGDTQLDEMLIGGSKQIEKQHKENTDKTMKNYTEIKDTVTIPFIRNIKTIDRIYNQPMAVLFDEKYLYIQERK